MQPRGSSASPGQRGNLSVLLAVLVLLGLSPPALANSIAASELQQVFASTVASNVTSYPDLAERLLGAQKASGNGSDPVAVTSDVGMLQKSSAYGQACWASSTGLLECLRQEQKCIPLSEIGQRFGLLSSPSPNTTASSTSPSSSLATSHQLDQLSAADVEQVAPALVYSLLSCTGEVDDVTSTSAVDDLNSEVESRSHSKPSTEATWGYSLLFVTLINLCALTGAFVLPCMRLQSYKLVLCFMVALAVGTLVGSGLLFLIPEAFALVHDDDVGYIWKASTIMGGIYLFYLTERIMRMINTHRENTQAKRKRDELATEGTITTSFRRVPVDNSIAEKDPSQIPPHFTGVGSLCGSALTATHPSNSSSCVEFAALEGSRDDDVEEGDVGGGSGAGTGDVHRGRNGGAHVQLLPSSEADKASPNGHHHSHSHSHASQEVAPVAYMIIFGDALHNFIDGLSIGSAFTQSTMTGVSVSVAVMCEELPHELGDLAILLNSGMPFRRALMYNFLSALTCYAGTVIGILLGENTQSHEWIFAIAGGMFLYISLVDMMPEMNSASESPEGKAFGTIKMFLLQNIGLLVGFSIMLIMALYGGNIDFS